MFSYIGSLQGALQNRNGVVLSRNVVEALGPAGSTSCVNGTALSYGGKHQLSSEAHYFSTHGWFLALLDFCVVWSACALVAAAAAAAFRALRSKKLAMLRTAVRTACLQVADCDSISIQVDGWYQAKQVERDSDRL